MKRKPEGPVKASASDLAILTRLYEVSEGCARLGDDVNRCLESVLDAAIFITAADKGNVQIFMPHTQGLAIVAQRGFQPAFLDFFSHVHDESAAACGAALLAGQRVVVEDVTQSEIFAGRPSLDVLLREDVRSVQSTPLLSSTRKVLGMISTHFREPTRLGDRQLAYLDLLARQCADYLERRHYEEALEAKQQQLQRIADNVGTSIAQCNRDLRYVFVNKACADFIGKPVEQIEDRPIAEVLGQRALDAIRPFIERVLAGERVEYEAEVPYAAAGVRHIHAVYVPDLDARGSICGWIATIDDVTDKKSTERELRDADRRKDEFLAMLAHELRNPLAPISTGAEILKRTGDVRTMHATLDMMRRQTQHMSRLVDDLLDVARMTSGKIDLRTETVALQDIAEQAVQSCRATVEGKQHRLTVTAPEAKVYVTGDVTRLVQVVCNLINNACKFMDKGGSIALTIEREGHEATLRVRDRGIGIAAEDIPRIFRLFSQLDVSRSRSLGGLGVGLALSKQVVVQHGGMIDVRSDGAGRGSEFVVRLPAASAQSQERRTRAPYEPTLVLQRRVLIVDDNRDAAESLAALLKLSGHVVRVAHDGLSGVELGDGLRPDIVLLDIGLPGIDGYETCRQMRALPWGRNTFLIALSGYGQASDLERARAAGFDRYLVKPISYENLVEALAGTSTHAH